MSSQPETGVLAADCEDFLSSQECYSVRDGAMAGIYDNDGHRMFTVTPAISVFDLRTIVWYGSTLYDRGVRAGNDGMREQLRNLLGAAPLEPLS